MIVLRVYHFIEYKKGFDNLRKIRIFIASLIMLVSSTLLPVYAIGTDTQPYNSNFKYSTGVGNLTVWINYSSGAGMWIDYINGGINNWMYTGWDNPIYITVVSSNVGSNMDFIAVEDFGPQLLNAYTLTSYFYGNGAELTSQNAAYYYTEIRINNSYWLSNSFSNDSAYGEMRHAMGHAFGLNDNNFNQYSIMCSYSMPRLVNTIQLTDNSAINQLYQ